MSIGQRLLDKLALYPVRPGWYTKVIQELAADLRTLQLSGSAVQSGGVGADGTISASALGTTTTGALVAKVNGVLKASLAALADVDLFATAGSVGQAIFADGSDASGISLATDEVAQVTLIATDSDGAGGANDEDGGALIYLAVVAGVGGASKTYQNQTAPLTSAQIRSALLGSTAVHDGATGFVRLADIVWDENSASPTAVFTVNRDA